MINVFFICTLTFIAVQQTDGLVCGTTPSATEISTTTNSTSRIIQASGCPGYDWTSQSTPNSATYQCWSYTIPLNPIMNSSPYYVGVYYDNAKTMPVPTAQVVLGTIGIASNGVVLYGNSDAEDRDAYVYESMSFDQCNGHAQVNGVYHYHSVPGTGCVYTDTPGQHSPLLGFMADGIPIYGIYGDNGVQPTTLDSCGGTTDSTYSFYHYHATNMVYPYLVNCLSGCLTGSNMLQNTQNAPSCVPASTQYDYSSLQSVWTSRSGYSCYGAATTVVGKVNGVLQATALLVVHASALLFFVSD